ncbi:HAD hydrolase [Linderina pennispora]|uniref:HAD hydrolase n=1 Tax=Linderina pennispora TaxID=61395 RepID=A0A1Y1WLK1_9FUNG|nr:HAD hydrolase [Linderina pennispora]ORX74245.1 HAD hydrolase [Linderina pennispora]
MRSQAVGTCARRLLAQQHRNLQTSTVARKQTSPLSWHLDTAVAFDIDGVLIKGKRTLDEGRRALEMLNGDNVFGKRIPFVLLTNGGGVTEAAKAADISRRLGVEIKPEQVILSHSPMQALAEKYSDKHVLVVGGVQHRCAEIARGYGFTNVSTPNDIVAWQPAAWPFMKAPTDKMLSQPLRDFSNDPFYAVLQFHDSFDYGRDLQIVTDVLRSRGGVIGSEYADHQVMPLYMSNPDLVYSNEYPRPRFGQGAFHTCLRAMWAALTNGKPLNYTLYGKPNKVQYQYAERVLDRMALQAAPNTDLGQVQAKRRVFAIGDNPAADIAGANGAGWTSVLVRTGVFSGPEGSNDPANPAHRVTDHVEEAVKWIIESEARRAQQSA